MCHKLSSDLHTSAVALSFPATQNKCEVILSKTINPLLAKFSRSYCSRRSWELSTCQKHRLLDTETELLDQSLRYNLVIVQSALQVICSARRSDWERLQ